MPSTLKLRSCTLFFHFTPYFQIVPHLKRASELNVYIILHFWYQLLFNITFIEWSETANERIERITRSALFNSNIKFSSSYSTFGGVVVVIWLLYGSSGFFFVNMHCRIVLVLFVFSMRIHTYNFTLYFVFPPNFIGMPCRCRRFLKKYEKKRRSVGAMLLLRIEWTRRCNIIFDAVFFYNFPGFVCSQILHFFP